MPIYEYRCTACAAEMEKLQKISDPPLVECPECGKDTLVKLVSASSFRLKGSGWYETDFKTGKKKNGVAEGGDSTATAGGDAAGAPAAKDTQTTAAATTTTTKDKGGSATGAASSSAA